VRSSCVLKRSDLSTRVIPDGQRPSGNPSLKEAARSSGRASARARHRAGRAQLRRSGMGPQTAPRPGVTHEASFGTRSPRALVGLSVATANQLFDALSDWNHILKDTSTDQLDQIDDPANDTADADAALKDALGGGHD